MTYQTHTLTNGLRIIHMPSAGNVSYCGFYVNAGTRDESDDEHGMAHFVEHMLFKGTKKRKSYHIINRMENVGGEMNAYTNKEETVLYSSFLNEDFQRAIELMSDMVFASEYPQREIDKEIEVVIDEIHSYEDSPSELIYDEFENLVFRGSSLGHNVLGDTGSVSSFDAQNVKSFVSRLYKPSNIVFFSLGKTDFKKVVYWAEKYMDQYPESETLSQRAEPQKINRDFRVLKRDTTQVHAVIGGYSYSHYDTNKTILFLLNNILGGPGMNSRLNMSLREKRGLVYNVESAATSFTDSGIFSIYFGCDKRNEQKCLDLVYKELSKLKTEKLSLSQLAASKKQLIGQIGVSLDNRESLALSLGKNYMCYNHYNSWEETVAKIERVTAEQIQDVANEIFDENNLFGLIYD